MDHSQVEGESHVDFSNTPSLVVKRWADAIDAIQQGLSSADRRNISAPRDWKSLSADLCNMASDMKTSTTTKRLLNQMIPLPRTLANVTSNFSSAIDPYTANLNVMWGLLDLTIQLSSPSPAKLTRMAPWVKKARNTLELFTRCLNNCKEDMNEGLLAMVDVLESLLQILGESVKYLRQFPSDLDPTKAWKALEIRIIEYLLEMETTMKHLNDITNCSKPNMDAQANNLSLRSIPISTSKEHCVFPVKLIPRQRNREFFGRAGEMEKINSYLAPTRNNNLRTYTIFGRRGVGKTDIALEYAYANTAGFDAIFWINCETLAALRSSFAAVATSLQLQNADRAACYEQSQVAVQEWLRTTTQHWLLIFDNAESDDILQGYWPEGANGSILITSRKYYNFAKYAERHGDTVRPFNDRQSWELLIRLLGPAWQKKDKDGRIKGSEEKAAKGLLKSIGGLALAIQQAAILIQNEDIGGLTIVSTFESFRHHQKSLPPRQISPRSDMEHALDSLWDMSFVQLIRISRDLLSVLSLLSPDGVVVDLFLPTNQKALDGKLEFCKQNRNREDNDTEATLSSVITEPTLLLEAINELVQFKLLKREGRTLLTHRVVQEAMNYHSSQDLQEYFDSASALVFEAFPKQFHGDILAQHWITCETFISHGICLSAQFDRHHLLGENQALKGSSTLIKLFANCAWYLYEIGDYDTCLNITKSGWLACEATNSLHQLDECRKNFEKFFAIQEKLLPENDLEKSSSLHYMGLLESASGNSAKAMDFFIRAIDIRTRGVQIHGNDPASNLLANSYLCKSRVHLKNEECDQALATLEKSEVLYLRTSGVDAPIMAHVHYARGNIEYGQKRWEESKTCYTKSLGILNTKTPVHPITAAAYFKLGCVEFELKQNKEASSYLKKALNIAKLRSPGHVNGTMARILWKTSVVLESDPERRFQAEANRISVAADEALHKLSKLGDCGQIMPLDDDGNVDFGELEEMYDALVPETFR